MHRVLLIMLLLVGLACTADGVVGQIAPLQDPAVQPDSDPVDNSDVDEVLLQKYNVATDGDSLLAYFRKRTFPIPDTDTMSKLIGQLGHADYHTREKAYSAILNLGPGAVGSLNEFRNTDDAETKSRVRDLIRQIENEANPLVQAAVARLIAQRRPKNACDVLLKYLPFAADEAVVEEITNTIGKLALANGQIDPAVKAALKDGLAIKRKAAGLALAKTKAKQALNLVRQLLNDREAKVRLAIALELVTEHKDATALPALIDVLAHLPPEQLWQVEHILTTLAKDSGPQVALGTDAKSRKLCRAAWKAWFDKNKDNIRLADLRLASNYLGYLTVVHQTNARVVNGKAFPAGRAVQEFDVGKKTRWQFVLRSTAPVAAQVLDKEKVIVTEYSARRVSLRDLEGRILKEYFFPTYPLSAQILSNGNIFVTLRNRLAEIDQQGKKKYTYTRPTNDIYRACKLRKGTIVFLTANGVLHYLDPTKNQLLKSFAVGSPGTYYGGLDAKANGNVLVPLRNQNQVVEVNSLGKVVHRFQYPRPTTAVYLPNGRIMVGSLSRRTVAEIDRKNVVTWSRNFSGNVYQIQYR